MNSLRKKIKRGAISCLALTMSATLFAGTALMDFSGIRPAQVLANTTENVKFTDVTGELDTSALVEQNLDPTVKQSIGATYETRTVIISLRGNSLVEDANGDNVSDYINTSLGRQSLKRIQSEQSAFLNSLSLRGIKYTLKHTYSTALNAVAIEINTANVSQIKTMGGVESAVISRLHAAPKVYTESGSASLIENNTNVYNTGIYDSHAVAEYDWGTGAGTVVAILDTGIDYTHDAFQTMPYSYRMDKDYVASKLGGTTAFKRITELGGTMTVDDVYVNEKIPFAYDYADNDFDVYPSYSNHGAHVAGIVAGYDENGYDKKISKIENGALREEVVHFDETFKGVATDAQLVICKTFTDDLDSENIGGALTEDILAALDDCVALGVDVINMSLGTTSGFTTTDDGDDEGDLMDKTYASIQEQGISLICAASNDYSSGFGSVFGTNRVTNPDSATVGSPSTYFSALSVASISGQRSPYMLAGDGSEKEIENAIFYEEARDGNSVAYDFASELLKSETKKTFEFVVVGKGEAQDYSTTVRNLLKNTDRLVLIERGNNTFLQKIELAYEMGAIGAIIYNNVSGTIRMSLGDITKRVPAVSITQDAGLALVARAKSGQNGRVGEITIDSSLDAGPFMSDFSSWGPTPDLKIKPEITAHGGEIISAVPGGYDAQSGTSMACPNMAGVTALVRNYVKTQLLPSGATAKEITQLTNQLLLSTATTVVDPYGLAYSPRKQGAGLASLDNIVSTKAYLYTAADCAGDYWYDELDGRPKIELGADKAQKGKYTFSFKIKNFGESALTFGLSTTFMTETPSSDKRAVAEKAYILDDIAPKYSVKDGTLVSGEKPTITVAGGQTADITVTVELSAAEAKYIKDSFENGMFVEGFVQLEGDGEQCDLSIPFLAFYGDWDNLPMLDYDCFDIADSQRDTSVDTKDKLNPTVFATQAYASYSNNKYIIPIGNYVYLQDESADQIYTTEDHGAISIFDETVSEDGTGSYYTANQIRCLYAGLLRNARRVEWTLYNAYTGEIMRSDVKYRVSKAYANGGSAVPGFIELNLTAEELGLVNNGKYRMEFDFYFNENSVYSEENSFAFNFYLDYDAPVLQDARVRYVNYTADNNKIKQRIYIDLDIYDNHYAQSVMLAYIDTTGTRNEMKLATEYFTPVLDSVKNGVNTVSIEVTDIWEQYQNRLVVQLDDYALNHSTYILGSLNDSSIGTSEEALNANVTPETFELAEGEENIIVGVNEAHTVALNYEGDANLSNFKWESRNPYVKVKNGEIVGVLETSRPQTVTVSNRKGVTKEINVTVVDNGKKLSYPSISFDVIRNFNDALVKASGYVRVHAGKDIALSVLTDPWYYPVETLNLDWSSGNPTVATVDDNGNVHTKTKGTAIITATIHGTTYSTSVRLVVQDEFTVDSFSLTEYHGDGEIIDGQEGVVIIPEGKNIMTIGERAFADNTKITKVIIPLTVTEIGERAFEGCTNLKEVCFISDEEEDVAASAMKLIRKYAFKGCSSLETLDLRNCKVITVAREAFADCVKLKEIKKSSAIGTAHDRAFMGCESLEEIDLSGLHVSGSNVFSGCTSLTGITTGKYTDIGDRMFTSLKYYYQEYEQVSSERWDWVIKSKDYDACYNLDNLVLKSAKVGVSAFEGCTGITNVKFEAPDATVVFNISDNAFKNCTSLASLTFEGQVKSIGAYAFKNTALTSVTLPDGLISIGEGAFDGTNLNKGNYQTSGSDFILSGDGKVLLLYIGTGTTCTIPAGVDEIAAYAFAGSSITSLTIPSTVVKIGEGAFKNSALTSVTVNANLTEIPAFAFFGTSISEISLPSSVTYIGDYAFGNSALTTFDFSPFGETELGSYVFSGCEQLVEIALDSKISVMGDAVFGGCTALERVELPALKALGAYTFADTPALQSVEFDEGAIVTGVYTFAAESAADRANLTSVKLGKSISAIGEGAFFNCASLTSVDLGGAEIIEANAFYGCTSLETVTGLEGVKTIGTLAFYNNNLKTLSLDNAENIGDGAFMIENGGAYTVISIPKAVTVGSYAFAGGAESTVKLPASLKEIGGGAFASSKNLTSFEIDADNKLYFKDADGVLYRYITDSTYELVAYPAGVTAKTLTDDFATDKKTYKVLDGTITIAASAFEGLKTGAIEHVVLPYTLKVIGSGAFFNSGIKEYRFESINAPVLLTEYINWIKDYIDIVYNDTYVGYFYSNFEDEFINHSQFGGALNSAELTIYRPENGVGYDTLIYSQYFANSVTTGINIDDITREVRDLILELPAASVISGWNSSNKSKSEVENFSELVKRIRSLYNQIINAAQLEILGDENINHLSDVESALRTIKAAYGIPVTITRVTRVDGSYKNTYYEGEKFSMKGLKVIVTYDDYSTEIVGADKLTLISTDPLTIFDRDVTVTYKGVECYLVITVLEGSAPAGGSGCNSGCNSVTDNSDTIIMTFAGLGAILLVASVLRRRKRITND